MPISHELEREFREISGTKFWKEFVDAINEARRILVRHLEADGSIGRACSLGEVWQERIRELDRILKLPYQIVGYDGENLLDGRTPIRPRSKEL